MGLALQHGSGIRFRPEGQPACKAWRLILPLCLRSEDSTYTRKRARYAQYNPARDEQSYSVITRFNTYQTANEVSYYIHVHRVNHGMSTHLPRSHTSLT